MDHNNNNKNSQQQFFYVSYSMMMKDHLEIHKILGFDFLFLFDIFLCGGRKKGRKGEGAKASLWVDRRRRRRRRYDIN